MASDPGLDSARAMGFCHAADVVFAGACDESDPVGVRATDAASAADHLPTLRATLRREHKVKSFSCLDHFLCMAFAQLTYRESLRDVEVCLRAQASKLYHLGLRTKVVARNTLAN